MTIVVGDKLGDPLPSPLSIAIPPGMKRVTSGAEVWAATQVALLSSLTHWCDGGFGVGKVLGRLG